MLKRIKGKGTTEVDRKYIGCDVIVDELTLLALGTITSVDTYTACNLVVSFDMNVGKVFKKRIKVTG